MASFGVLPFAKGPKWLADQCKRQFGRTIAQILRSDLDLDDLAVANRMVEWFEPVPLTFGEPSLTTLTWNTVKQRVEQVGEHYLHEAQVPYQGTSDLWRLIGCNRTPFATKISTTLKTARLRALRQDRNTERFREDVTNDLVMARRHTANQGPAIDAFRTYLHTAVDAAYGHQDFGS